METKPKSTVAKPKAVAKKETRTTLKVANTTIVIGESYEVRPKMDYSAPDGMQKAGTTKFLHEGNSEIRGINFDDNRRKWDTGFDDFSLCNSDLLPTEKEKTIELYNKYIREPYERDYQVDCGSTNDSFWNDYSYELYTNKTFNTNDPKDLFDLFQALKHGRICEPKEKDFALKGANYTIKNINKVKSIEEERLAEKFEAITTFSLMLNEDLDKDDTLIAILEWMQITNVRGVDKDIIRNIMMRMFDNPTQGYDTAKRFLDATKLVDSTDGKKRMELFSLLQKLYSKNKIDTKRGAMYLNSYLLGNTLKEASQRALDNADLAKEIYLVYEQVFGE